MKKKTIAILIALVLLLAIVIPVAAITDGELDGDGHPHVVLLQMDIDGKPTYRCSATMLSPTVVLTAGHCTSNYGDVNYPEFPEYSGMRIYTESDVDNGIYGGLPYENGECNLGDCYEAAEWYAHPLYETAPFFYHDVGIVILEEPFYPNDDLTYEDWGVLPEVDQFDAMKTKRGKQDTSFTAVGYGLQQSFPNAVEWKTQADRIRYVAYPKLIQINAPGFTGDYSLLLSNNPNTGGTCFGDSGGPNFLGGEETETNIVAGVTSFGINGNCAGTGGVFRMDRQNVIDFVCSYGPFEGCP